jgi:hypothetical protein
MQDVEIDEALLAAVVVTDDVAAAIAEAQGFPEELSGELLAAGKEMLRISCIRRSNCSTASSLKRRAII